MISSIHQRSLDHSLDTAPYEPLLFTVYFSTDPFKGIQRSLNLYITTFVHPNRNHNISISARRYEKSVFSFENRACLGQGPQSSCENPNWQQPTLPKGQVQR